MYSERDTNVWKMQKKTHQILTMQIRQNLQIMQKKSMFNPEPEKEEDIIEESAREWIEAHKWIRYKKKSEKVNQVKRRISRLHSNLDQFANLETLQIKNN